jgi:uroporphyrin-3 C-methyltransferase
MSEPNSNMATIIESRPVASGNAGIKLLVLASWAALAAIGWFGWQQRQTIAALETQIGTLAGASSEVGALQQTQRQLDSARQQLDQQVMQLAQNLQQLQGSQQQAQTTVLQQLQMMMSNVSDQTQQLNQLGSEVELLQLRVADDGSAALRAQLLAEVAGMLRIAELRLQLAHDVDTAATLVRSADAVLARVNDPSVAGLRARLANDLVALQAAPQVDVLALYRQLGDSITQLDSLTVVSTDEVADLQVTPTDNGLPAEPGWFNEAADFLGQYFVLTKRDAAIAPLLSPAQDWLIRKSIALQLQQARLAALEGNAELYKTALTEARTALAVNLQGGNKTALLAQLDTLSMAALRTSPPSLAASIAALQQLQSAPAASTTP